MSKYRKAIECREQTNIPIPGRRAAKEGLLPWLADTNGSILVQFTVVMIAMMGLVGLTVDGARFLMLNNDLQDLADAAALAGAADLDGSSTATSAIPDAMAFGNANNVHWYNISGSPVATVHLYQTLADAEADTNNVDNNQRLASFIRVWTGAWGVTPTFLAAVGAKSASTSAQAIAQSSISQCIPLQAMMCNPNEPSTFASYSGAMPGKSYTFSTTGNTGGMSPGDFNLIDPPGGGGADKDIESYLSSQNLGACTVPSQSGINPAQGQKTNATIIGINVRFDQQPNNPPSGLDLTPSPLRTSGYYNKGNLNECKVNQLTNYTPPEPGYAAATTGCGTGSTISCGFPADRTTTNAGTSVIGNGVLTADLQAYWTNHHGTTFSLPALTRYGVYTNEVNTATLPWKTDTLEQHAPYCQKTCAGNPECVAQRRILSVAIVDCNFWNVHGNAVNNIPINTYADFFLTNPSDGNIYTEYVGTHSIAAGNAPGLHQTVELVK